MLARVLIIALVFASSINAATVTYNWSLSWIYAAPDGVTRPIIAINKKWPPPAIIANKGDQVVINLTNNLQNQSASLHFHGLKQYGNNAYDGPVSVTQCAIPPTGNNTFTYTFPVPDNGTFWYHSHFKGQYADGLRGPLIVRDAAPPFQYDEHLFFTISDWYHQLNHDLTVEYRSSTGGNPWGTGNEPVPDSMLLNDTQGLPIDVLPGKTYFIEVINVAAFSDAWVHFDQHNFTIVSADGVYMQPQFTQDLYLSVGQRYGVLMKTMSSTTKNYGILGTLNSKQYVQSAIPVTKDYNGTVGAYLRYNESAPVPATPVVGLNQFNSINDGILVPYYSPALLSGTPAQQIFLNLGFKVAKPYIYADFNNISYVAPNPPTLFTVLNSGSAATNPSTYPAGINPYVLTSGQLIEIVVNNTDGGPHPIHLHGHQPQMVYRRNGAGNPLQPNPTTTSSAPGSTSTEPPPYHPQIADGSTSSPNGSGAIFNDSLITNQTPLARDVFIVPAYGIIVLRFLANNPGVWFLHCHFEWHLEIGMAMTLVEAPLQIQKSQSIPQQMLNICGSSNGATPVGINDPVSE